MALESEVEEWEGSDAWSAHLSTIAWQHASYSGGLSQPIWLDE